MITSHNAETLKYFEWSVACAFNEGKIKAPIHLSGGNEEQLLEIFREVRPEDWVLSTWRSHYHALLKGVPADEVMAEILAGRSMNLHFPKYKFLTSAIVGGILPIACGLAAGGDRVWCFVGDMCASLGHFQDATNFSRGHNLDVHFVVEDNGLSTNTPTRVAWGEGHGDYGRIGGIKTYTYKRHWPHYGISNVGF